MPGPGTYKDQTAMSRTGVYFNSKFKNTGAQKFSTGKRNFNKISKLIYKYIIFTLENDNPGPGMYTPKNEISTDGIYAVSHYKNSVTRKFGSPNP